MGWRNMFIDASKTPINRIEEFIYHHNNWTQFFTEEEVKKIWDDDEVPGEDLDVRGVLIRKTETEDEYWIYLGNGGGSGWTISWAEKYFPDVKVFTSYDFKYYDEDWRSWKIIKIKDFKDLCLKKVKME